MDTPTVGIDSIDRVNSGERTPVVFVHGLWLLSSRWDRWAESFSRGGFAPLAPGWPDDPATVGVADTGPETSAGKTVGQVTAATAAIDPAPFRGILPLPPSSLHAARPALGLPASRHRAVALTYEQFRYAFANALDEDEAQHLYATFAVPRRELRCSTPPRPTSARAPKSGSIPPIQPAGRSSSCPASTTTPSPGPSLARRSSASGTTSPSLRSNNSPAAATR